MGTLAIGAALTGLGALTGLFGNKQKSTSDVNNTTTNTPTYDGQAETFRNWLIGSFTNQANQFDEGGPYEQAYRQQGLNQIRLNAHDANNAVDSLLAARGLTRTTAGANTVADSGYRQGATISNFLNNVPIQMAQLKDQALSSAGGFFSSLPYTTTQHQQGTVVNTQQGGGGFGGAAQGGASALGGFLGQLYKNGIGKPKTP